MMMQEAEAMLWMDVFFYVCLKKEEEENRSRVGGDLISTAAGVWGGEGKSEGGGCVVVRCWEGRRPHDALKRGNCHLLLKGVF